MIEQLTTDEATVWTVAGAAVLALGAVAALQAKRMAAQANRARVRVRARVPSPRAHRRREG
jgi:hypothetical protein